MDSNHGISYQQQYLHGLLNFTVKLINWTLSQAERSLAYYQCPGDKRRTESIDCKSTVVSSATTVISNSNDKNTKLCECDWNVCHSTHGTSPQDEVRNLCTSRPTQALQTQWTLRPLDPLNMLFQSALAMHSFIKSVVASQNILLGSSGVSLVPKAMRPGYEATQEFLQRNVSNH